MNKLEINDTVEISNKESIWFNKKGIVVDKIKDLFVVTLNGFKLQIIESDLKKL